MDFSFDYGAVSITPPAKDAPLFASIEGRAAALGGDEVAFYDSAADRTHVMTVQVLQAMDLCRDFQTLDVHVQRVAERLPGVKGQAAAVRRVLESLASRGLLLSDDAWMQRFENAPARAQADVAGVYIRCCDRPPRLRALLASLIEVVRQFPPPAPLVLVDDSSQADAAAEHRRLLADFSAASGLRTRYIGPQEWSVLADEVARVAPAAAALLRHAPQGRRGGGPGRNLINLLSAGRRHLLLDDDFVFPLRRHPEARTGMALGGGGWALRTFPSHEQALHAGVADGRDPWRLHLSICGQSLGQVLARQPDLRPSRAHLRGLMPSRMPLLDPQRRVVATLNGHRGNSGASGIAWLYLLGPEARAGLCADEAAYAALRGDPPVWWGVSTHQIEASGTFTPFAVDASLLLPPCSANGRGEDALSSELTQLAHGDTVQIDLPYTIGHVQDDARDRSAQLQSAETADVNHCLAELAKQVAPELHSVDPARRLAVFASRLQDISASSDRSLVSYLREFQTYRRSLLVERLQQVAKASESMPKAWQQDLQSQLEANGRAIVERGAPRFAGWPEDATRSQCAQRFRAEADALAAGLLDWPAAWDLALERQQAWAQGDD